MSRVNVHRNLIPLKNVLGHFPGFPAGKSHQQVIVTELRAAAQKLRSASSQPFYSMRDVASFFEVPLGTITRVYKVLETEGIISRIRSSHTVLAGKEVSSREAVRGVVGIYVWLHSMVLLVYTQSLVMELEERLRRLGYVADIIFHSADDEEKKPEFATRLLLHRLDVVILHTPLAVNQQNIHSLRERGVRIIVVQRKDTQCDLPAVIYLLDYQPAYHIMAKRWHQIGIRKAFLCTPSKYLNDKTELAIMKTILEEHGLEVELAQDDPHQLLKRTRKRAKLSTVLVFLDCTHSELICNREPQVIEKISRIARLAFCVGAVRVPYLQFRKIRADVVDLSPTEVALRLANDISRLSVLPDGIYHTFLAHYSEQVPI